MPQDNNSNNNQPRNRLSVKDIKVHKGKTPLVCLTCYSTPFAKILDKHVDILLVGDSLGMVLYGMKNTRGVTLDMMINHGKAVVNASRKAFVVVDMPFGSYQKSKQQALENCRRVIKETGCDAVKMEGGTELASTVKFLREKNIEVMGHVGLMPQYVKTAKDYKYKGRTPEEAKKIMADAIAIEKSGAFSIVLEAIDEKLARNITKKLSIPTIGIGASLACDGQVLVAEDMLGLDPTFKPRFVKNYTKLNEAVEKAVKEYTKEVRSRKFPSKEHLF